MISTVIDICKNIVDFISKRNDIKNENIQKISKILEEISSILEDTANKLLKDEYPHNNCVIMEKLSNELHLNLSDYFPQQEIDDLHRVLIESSKVEKEFATRKEPDTIPNLQKAAGEFKAMSILISIRK